MDRQTMRVVSDHLDQLIMRGNICTAINAATTTISAMMTMSSVLYLLAFGLSGSSGMAILFFSPTSFDKASPIRCLPRFQETG